VAVVALAIIRALKCAGYTDNDGYDHTDADSYADIGGNMKAIEQIIELAKGSELADKLTEYVQVAHLQHATQAAYHQGQADAYRQIHVILTGNVKFTEQQTDAGVEI